MKALIVAGCMVALLVNAQTLTDPIIPCPEHSYTFCGGEAACWLRVERYNTKDRAPKCFDPSYTQIISDFKPVATKQADGKWQIVFVTEDFK